MLPVPMSLRMCRVSYANGYALADAIPCYDSGTPFHVRRADHRSNQPTYFHLGQILTPIQTPPVRSLQRQTTAPTPPLRAPTITTVLNTPDPLDNRLVAEDKLPQALYHA